MKSTAKPSVSRAELAQKLGEALAMIEELKDRLKARDKAIDEFRWSTAKLDVQLTEAKNKNVADARLIAILRNCELTAQSERWKTAELIHDLQLVTVAGAHMLCGSFWIRGELLLEVMRRRGVKQ